MLKKIFFSLNGEAKSITGGAIIIALTTLASKLLGLLRDRVLAGMFGAERPLDIYYASFRIPDFVFNLLVLGILSAGFIPVFTGYLKKSSESAWKLVNELLTMLTAGLTFVCIVLIIIMPVFAPFIAPGFTQGELSQTIQLTRIMFLSPLLLGISGIFGGVLQSYKRFFSFSVAPIFYNVGIIFGAIFFVPLFGLVGLAWGVVVGSIFHLFTQALSVARLGYMPRPVFSFSHHGIREIFFLMVPRTMSLALSQINFLIITILGSYLEEGSITIFHLANNLQSTPLMLFGISFAIAAFPALSESAGSKHDFVKNLSLTLRQILFFIIPSSAIFILLRAQIVRAVFGSGNFDWNDTIRTMNTLAIFSVSLFAQSLIHLLSRAFFALKDSATPFFVGLLSTIVNISLSMFFVFVFPQAGVEELALAFSISSVIHLLFLWVILKVKLGEFDEMQIFFSTIKISFAAFCMALSVQGVKYAIEPFFGTRTFVGIALQGGVAILIGTMVYIFTCLALRSPEATLFISSMRRKIFRHFTPSESADQGEY